MPQSGKEQALHTEAVRFAAAEPRNELKNPLSAFFFDNFVVFFL
jgi:hypothetical protein